MKKVYILLVMVLAMIACTASSAEHYGALLNLDFVFRTYLKTLSEDGMNYTRIFTGSYFEIEGESFGIQNNTLAPKKTSIITPWGIVVDSRNGNWKYDLSSWNKAYFQRLHDFMAAAAEYDIIVEAEQQFAREVTLGVIVTRPLTVWHTIIPGFFIVDFLRRGSAIRQYTKHFMFSRQLALDAAVAAMQTENKILMGSNLADNIGIRLESLKLYSSDLVKAYAELIEILAAHYLKLLNAEGDTMYHLIEHAYQNTENFKHFIETITPAENKVDRQVIKQLGGTEKVKEKILTEQQQIAKRRQKILEEVF